MIYLFGFEFIDNPVDVEGEYQDLSCYRLYVEKDGETIWEFWTDYDNLYTDKVNVIINEELKEFGLHLDTSNLVDNWTLTKLK